jgi:hypothetical protein
MGEQALRPNALTAAIRKNPLTMEEHLVTQYRARQALYIHHQIVDFRDGFGLVLSLLGNPSF